MIIYNLNNNYSWSIRYLLSANNVVLISYLCTSPKLKYLKANFDTNYICVRPNLFLITIIVMYVIYISQTFYHVVSNFEGARQLGSATGGGTLSGAFIKSFGMVLPAMIGYYVVRIERKSKWFALLLCLPIIFFLFILGTRFRLLFSIAPFFLVTDFIRLKDLNKKSILYITIISVVLVSFTNSMKKYRNNSFLEVLDAVATSNETFSPASNNHSLSAQICNNCSPEGIVEMTYLANRYFENHDLKYGECTGMIFYFWIPRKVWEDKPTQLDYWMPRYFNPELAGTFSSASGFTGEVRADFGLFSYLFMILFGFLLRKVNTMLIVSDYGRKKSYSTLYVVILIPYVFFFVRSPLTSSFNLIFEMATIYIVGYLCFAKQHLKKQLAKDC